MATVFLVLAILSEVAGTTALKFSHGFTNFWPSALVISGYVLSTYLMSLALRGYGIGPLYAIWSAAGTAAVFAIGVWFLHEPFRPVQLLWLVMIIVGVVGLQLSTKVSV